MKVIHSNDCLLHGPQHEILSGKLIPYLESPARYLLIKEALSQHDPEQTPTPLFDFVEADDSFETDQHILSVHTNDYVNYLRDSYEDWVQDGGDKAAVLPDTFLHSKLPQFRSFDASRLSPIAKAGLYCFDLSTPITADTYTSAVAAVRVTLTASRILSAQLQGRNNATEASPPGIFALTRPPGHHAGTSLCGGYCFFNNVAIAARFLQSDTQSQSQSSPTAKAPPKIAILDIDYHHGNGTQEIFYDDPSVFYVSLHATQDYPYYTGASGERGAGEGYGFNLNIPLPRRSTGDAEYSAALHGAIEQIRAYDPTYLILSLGVDTFQDDPICEFKLTRQSYILIGAAVAALQKPTLFVMEGGYDLNTIGMNVRAVLESFIVRSGRAG